MTKTNIHLRIRRLLNQGIKVRSHLFGMSGEIVEARESYIKIRPNGTPGLLSTSLLGMQVRLLEDNGSWAVWEVE